MRLLNKLTWIQVVVTAAIQYLLWRDKKKEQITEVESVQTTPEHGSIDGRKDPDAKVVPVALD